MQAALAEVLKHPGIWRGDGFSQAAPATVDCRHTELAALLPGGGWPQAAVTELIASRAGCGELKLLLPALAELTRAGRQVLLIAPPQIPYAPAWQAAGVDLGRLTWVDPACENDAQWAMEQALREPACGAVVGWFGHALTDRQCRRLLVAAEAGGACGFVLRQGVLETTASPFPLRLSVNSVAGGVTVRVLKRRGSPADRPLFLPHATPVRPADHAVARPLSAEPAARRAAPRAYACAG